MTNNSYSWNNLERFRKVTLGGRGLYSWGKDGRGKVRQGKEWCGEDELPFSKKGLYSRQGQARTGWDWQGSVRYGVEGCGMDRLGMDGFGEDRTGKARHGQARQGKDKLSFFKKESYLSNERRNKQDDR